MYCQQDITLLHGDAKKLLINLPCHGEKLKGIQRNWDGSLSHKFNHGKNKRIAKFGMRTNIWKITNGYFKSSLDKIAYQHPAIFPESLARDHVISWSNRGDTVLGPFLGSGTTGEVCKQLGRKFIGIELDARYLTRARAISFQAFGYPYPPWRKFSQGLGVFLFYIVIIQGCQFLGYLFE